MPGMATARGRACRAAAPPGPARAVEEAPSGLPLAPLTSALAQGDAMFGTSVILAHIDTPPASLTRQRVRLSAICQDLPHARIGGGGITHATSGLAFADLAVGPSGYLVGCGKAYHGTLSPGPPADIITGICLFGADSFIGTAAGRRSPLTAPEYADRYTRRPFEVITVDERLHVYEAETIARLSSFIRDLAGQLAPAPVRVHAHIPAPEYQLHGLGLYARGYLTRDGCERYAQAARRRGRLVARMLQAAMGSAADVQVCSPMSWLSEVDPYRVPPADLPQLLRMAARRQGRLWQVLADAGTGSLRDLSHASYLHHYLAAAERSQCRGRQLVVVENADEEPIYRHAAVLQQQTGILLDRAAGFYVHPQVVVRQTAFPRLPRLIYNCKDGCSPRTVRAAMPDGTPSETARQAG